MIKFAYFLRSLPESLPTHDQIISRARQNHLIENFRSESNALTPELVDTVFEAWTIHVRDKVNKGLPSDQKVVEGSEEASWPKLSVLIQNAEWKQECLKRDEKFDMHFTAAVSHHYIYLVFLNSFYLRIAAYWPFETQETKCNLALNPWMKLII